MKLVGYPPRRSTTDSNQEPNFRALGTTLSSIQDQTLERSKPKFSAHGRRRQECSPDTSDFEAEFEKERWWIIVPSVERGGMGVRLPRRHHFQRLQAFPLQRWSFFHAVNRQCEFP